jgi:hypothetical protein
VTGGEKRTRDGFFPQKKTGNEPWEVRGMGGVQSTPAPPEAHLVHFWREA